MKDTKSINLDVRESNDQYISVIQFDSNSRILKACITSNGEALDLTNHSVIFSAIKPDGYDIFSECTITNASAGIIDIVLSQQALAKGGVMDCQCKIIGADNSVLSTQTFQIHINKSTMSVTMTSSDEYDALIKALSKVQSITNKAERTEVRLLKDSIKMEDLHTDVKMAMTGGSVAVVGENAIGAENLKDNCIEDNKVQRVSTSKLVNTVIDTNKMEIWNKGPSDQVVPIKNGFTFTKAKSGDCGPMTHAIKFDVTNLENVYITYEYESSRACTLWLFKGDGSLAVTLSVISASPSAISKHTYVLKRATLDEYGIADNFRLVWAMSGTPTTTDTLKIYNLAVNTNGLGIDLPAEITNFDGNHIKGNSIKGESLKDSSIENRHLQNECVSNVNISSLNIDKIFASMLMKNEFVHWGSQVDSGYEIIDDIIHYTTSTTGDKGIMSRMITIPAKYSNLYISIVGKAIGTRFDFHIFDSNGEYKKTLGEILPDSANADADGFVTFQSQISKETMESLGLTSTFKIVIAIHNPGEFFIKDFVLGTTKMPFNNLPNVIQDLYDKTENPDITIEDIKNPNSVLFTGENMVKWGTPSEFSFDEAQNIISYSYTPTSGNSGFMTTPFKYDSKYRLKVSGNIIELGSGKINAYIKGKTIATGSTVYYSYKLLSTTGPFEYILDMASIVKGRDPINMDSIEMLFANSGVVTSCKIKDFSIINESFDFTGDHLGDILNNLEYRHIKAIDTVFVDMAISDNTQFSQWAGGSYTIENGQINLEYLQDTGNGGVRTKYFTSKTNFVIIEGSMPLIEKHTDSSLIQIYICGKKINGDNAYLTIAQLKTNTDKFRYVVDLNYHVVYNNLDLNQQIYVLFGSVGKVSATFENIRIYENEMSQMELIGDTLKDTLINMNTAIGDLRSQVSGTADDSVMISPSGNKFIMQVSDDGIISAIPVIPDKTLFIGNSLLNGHGTFGMCATDSKNDYYYHMKQYILGKKSNATFDKLAGSPFEGCTSQSEVDNWIQTNIDPKIPNNYDLILVQLGDNVNTTEKNEMFKTSCQYFLQALRKKFPKARVVWVGAWYTTDTKQQIMAKSCKATGSKFVDIRNLNTSANQGRIGDTITSDTGQQWQVSSSGVASHPNNTGMKAIADRLIDELFE